METRTDSAIAISYLFEDGLVRTTTRTIAMRMDHAPPDEDEWVDVTISIERLIRLAGRWMPAITILSLAPYFLAHGVDVDLVWPGFLPAAGTALLWILAALLVYAVSALVHEALHLLAMVVVGRVPLSSLKIGARLRDGVLYVHTPHAMTARAYRIVLLLPALALGLAPLIAGTLVGRFWMVLYGYVMLISAIGDFAVLQLIRDVSPSALVRDHPREVGCRIRASSDPG